MTPGLLIVSGGLVFIATLTALLGRRRENAVRRKLAARHDWEVVGPRSVDWRRRLQDVAIWRIGHSRRIDWVYRTRGGAWLFPYVFETGYEHRHATHSWRVVVYEVSHACSRAAVTRQDWLITTTAAPVAHQMALEPSSVHVAGGGDHCIAVIEDEEEWQDRFKGGLADWFLRQPHERNWEIQPGLLVGYEPGLFGEAEFQSLDTAAHELRHFLCD